MDPLLCSGTQLRIYRVVFDLNIFYCETVITKGLSHKFRKLKAPFPKRFIAKSKRMFLAFFSFFP